MPIPRPHRLLHLLVLVVASCSVTPPAADPDPFGEHVRNARALDGFLPVYVDDDAGQVWLVLPAPDSEGVALECIHVEGLATGLGSNPVGLDRGQLGDSSLVRFRRVGARVLFERQNVDYRALSDDPDERAATSDSFATSVLWATDVADTADDGRLLVEITSLVVRDAHGTARSLGASGGTWRLDPERSALDPRAVLAFPDNLEFEALLTFAGSGASRDIRSTTPDASSVTLVQHQSLVRLPDDSYTPRPFHPRSGGFAHTFQDYAAPLDGHLDVQWVVRHRLEKADPGAARSPAVEPLVYHVDRGAPEPIRGALIEGASWWNQAFEAAGFEDAFRVELLPEGAHPLDVRYNVIQWVHRSTRGWSYGNSVRDPRTGEILKGHVSLGSLRVRQDRLLFEGLLGTEHTGSGRPDDPIVLSLARIRQLSAHEVGHTLGLAHNFAASTWTERASVMDYPAPRIRRRADGSLDTSEAYAVGVGAWDVHSVRYHYSVPAPGVDEAAHLAAILDQAEVAGLRYGTDSDARAPGAAHPYASLWDDGRDPITALDQALAVRQVGLANFGRDRLPVGRSLARLEEVLAPVYFHHRYQLDAALKSIGGLDYDHRLRGEGRPGPRPVPREEQRRALKAVLRVLDEQELALPDHVRAELAPRGPGAPANRELFDHRTDPAFDHLGAAATMADQVVSGLLQRERAARLLDPQAPLSLAEVIGQLVQSGFPEGPTEPSPIQRTVRRTIVDGLIRLASDPRAPQLAREMAEDGLRACGERADTPALAARVRRFLERSLEPAPTPAPAAEPPPGSPIGIDDLGSCSRDG